MIDTVQHVIDALKKKHGKDTARKMSDGVRSQITEVIPTGILPLDEFVIGYYYRGTLLDGILNTLYHLRAGPWVIEQVA